MEFECTRRSGKRIERWKGIIPNLKKFGSHYEMHIESRSGITVLFGKTSYGTFACMPDFGAGCHLASLKDKFWNTEMLSRVLGTVDAITVAEALYAVSDKVEIDES